MSTKAACCRCCAALAYPPPWFSRSLIGIPLRVHLTALVCAGPNAGGKSVYIRAIGVLAVLAQIGSYVPADSAVMPVFDCVAARIGAGDK